MDLPDIPPFDSPRRELQLQGRRPTPLRVHKDSHKIRKPPVAPPPAAAQHHHHHHPPPPPVIIYTVSPKIIHTNPNEFKSVVQRLTGRPNSSSSTLNISPPSTSASSSAPVSQENGGGISPAARLYSTEETHVHDHHSINGLITEGIQIGTEIQQFPGIFSSNPSQNFFSTSSEFNSSSFFPDFSAVLQSNRNYENGFITPGSITPYTINPPSPNSLDDSSSLFDFQPPRENAGI